MKRVGSLAAVILSFVALAIGQSSASQPGPQHHVFVLNVPSDSTGTIFEFDLCGKVRTFAVEIPKGALNMAMDKNGNIYVAHVSPPRISKITPDGTVTKLLDSSNALINTFSVAVDNSGNVFIGDGNPNTPTFRILKLDSAGNLSAFVGYASGVKHAGDLEVDSSGNLLVAHSIAELANVLKVTPSGQVSVMAELPDTTGNGGIDVDSKGNVYQGTFAGNIFKITPSGEVSLFASGFLNVHLAVDADDNILVANQSRSSRDNPNVEKITQDGKRTVFADDSDGVTSARAVDVSPKATPCF